MLEVIKSLLTSPAGSFAFIFALMIAAGWLIHYVTKHSTKYICESMSDRVKVEKVETSLSDMFRDIAYIKGAIDLIRSTSSNSPTQAHSPVGLSELGEKIAEELNVQEMIIDNWDKISSYLEANLQSKNAYDIQQFCIDTASVSIDKFFSAEDIDKIKKYAFQNGQTLFYYGGLIGVMIRDEYFEKKGIDIADVDKHDPAKK